LKDVPMLLLWGMKDFVFDPVFLKEWERRFPEAQSHRFHNGGHYLFEDEAATVNDLVRVFLAAHPVLAEPVG
jgi:haloalkane dehalogenase